LHKMRLKMNLRTISLCLICLLSGYFYLSAQAQSSFKDLPLYLSGSKGDHDDLVIYLSGDGGWNSFNQQFIQEFESLGYGVVALNTRKYFWDEKSPELFARDIEQLSRYYLKEWNKSSLIIVGYSFGADVAIFLPNRISAEVQKKIKKIVLLSPSASTDFVIKLSDMMGRSENADRKYKVGPEIEKNRLPIICIFGKEEEMSLKNTLEKKPNIKIVEVPGDHQYKNNLKLITKMLEM